MYNTKKIVLLLTLRFGDSVARSVVAMVVALSCGCVGGFGLQVWMVVKFVCVIRVPVCAHGPVWHPGVFLPVHVFRVSRVCPGSPRCLFTGTCTVPGMHSPLKTLSIGVTLGY